ncbi:MAG: twin-arginine translocase TatA/TatE family subunit [Hyphomicrobiales bacterium]
MTLIFLDISGGEILLILLAIIIVFGPSKIPEFAKKFGKGMAEIKKASNDIRSEINSEIEKLDHTEKDNNNPKENQSNQE